MNAEINCSLQTQTFSDYIKNNPNTSNNYWEHYKQTSGVPYRDTSDKIPRTLKQSVLPGDFIQSGVDMHSCCSISYLCIGGALR
eukprot:15365255-Ditylum_brightwellii.AAC.1